MQPTVVRPMVEIDALNAARLDEELRGCDAEGLTVVDLERVRLCDAAGVRVLVIHALRHLHAGGTLRVRSASPLVRRVFHVVGVTQLLGIDD